MEGMSEEQDDGMVDRLRAYIAARRAGDSMAHFHLGDLEEACDELVKLRRGYEQLRRRLGLPDWEGVVQELEREPARLVQVEEAELVNLRRENAQLRGIVEAAEELQDAILAHTEVLSDATDRFNEKYTDALNRGADRGGASEGSEPTGQKT
jgi:hypothetical protein